MGAEIPWSAGIAPGRAEGNDVLGSPPKPGFLAVALLLSASLALIPCAQAAEPPAEPAAPVTAAEVAPDDSLLYVEIAKPAELWAALQKTELRRAVQASFLAEVIVAFTGNLANLLCQALTDRPLGEATTRYGLRPAIVFSPVRQADGSDDPAFVVVLQAASNGAELAKLLAERVEPTLKARFPDIAVEKEQVRGHDVTTIRFSPKSEWSLAAAGDRIMVGQRPAVKWMLESTRFLGRSAAYRAARERLKLPGSPHVFCYCVLSEDVAPTYLYGPGSVLAGVLEMTRPSPADGRQVADRILISGKANLPPVGPRRPFAIGKVFPQGAWFVNQVSLASGAAVAEFLGMDAAGTRAKLAGRAFSGTCFPAVNGAGESIVAAEAADAGAVVELLEQLRFAKEGDVWLRDPTAAAVKDGFVYIGKARALRGLLADLAKGTLAAPEGLKLLPETAHGFSLMTPGYLKACLADGYKEFEGLAAELSPSVAAAEVTADGIDIRSVSPHGYGLWLVSMNIEAAIAANRQANAADRAPEKR